ncbi:hypothetical protein K435DRAFT_881126, partial [Dendrothele bispora CBS 962.96]
MTRKLRTEQKKPPGRLPWYRKNDQIEAFLVDHYDEFEKCFKAKTITSFYTSMTTKYFLQFGKEQDEDHESEVTSNTQVSAPTSSYQSQDSIPDAQDK